MVKKKAFEESEELIDNMKSNDVDIRRIEQYPEERKMSVYVDEIHDEILANQKSKIKKSMFSTLTPFAWEIEEDPDFNSIYKGLKNIINGYEVIHIYKKPNDIDMYLDYYKDNLKISNEQQLKDFVNSLIDSDELDEENMDLYKRLYLAALIRNFNDDVDMDRLSVITNISKVDIKKTHRGLVKDIV